MFRPSPSKQIGPIRHVSQLRITNRRSLLYRELEDRRRVSQRPSALSLAKQQLNGRAVSLSLGQFRRRSHAARHMTITHRTDCARVDTRARTLCETADDVTLRRHRVSLQRQTQRLRGMVSRTDSNRCPLDRTTLDRAAVQQTLEIAALVVCALLHSDDIRWQSQRLICNSTAAAALDRYGRSDTSCHDRVHA